MVSQIETTSCEEIDATKISRAEFHERYVRPGKPVILRGGIAHWKALERWPDREYLTKAFGDQSIPIAVEQVGREFQMVDTPLREFWRDTWEPVEGRHCYLLEQPILAWGQPSVLGAIAGDIDIPSFFDASSHLTAGIFAGNGTRSVCHYHPAGEVLLCQVVGKKRVLLFSPEGKRFNYLYPQHWFSGLFSFSKIEFPRDGAWPDLDKYPDLTKAQPVECILEPGDMLFIPIYWWHIAYGTEISVSVANWWMASFQKRYLSPKGVRSNYLNKRLLVRHLSMESVRSWMGILRSKLRPAK